MFVMWLGEQITERGLGNGASLIIFFSIIERFWPGIFSTFRFVQTQACWAVLAARSADRDGRSRRRHGCRHDGSAARADPDPAAHDGARTACARRQRTSFRCASMHRASMPIIFAQSVIVVPGAIAQFSGNPRRSSISPSTSPRARGCTTSSQAVLIVFFTYFYTSIIFNPIDLSENLKKQGGFIPGREAGAKTAEYIDHVVSRITLPGAMFLTFIALLPHVHRGCGQRAVPVRRHVAADRGGRGARHDGAGAAAPAAAEVRRLHEEGPRPISAVASAMGGF